MKQISLLAATTPSSPPADALADGALDRVCVMAPQINPSRTSRIDRPGDSHHPWRVRNVRARQIRQHMRLYPPPVRNVNSHISSVLFRDLLNLIRRENLRDLIDPLDQDLPGRIDVGAGRGIEELHQGFLGRALVR